MQVVCAPDSFKESISSADAARALARGQSRVGNLADCCPVADGGEGTLAVLVAGDPQAQLQSRTVTGPLGTPVTAHLALLGDGSTAVVELAEAAGLGLVMPNERDPEQTTTFGVGELVRAAIDAGAETIVIAVGGSATCDGGAGMAQALGVRFLDERGAAIAPPLRGGDLRRIASIRAAPPLPARLRVACDVTNPLLGPHGAAAVYAPQKGATPIQVERLEAGLAALAACAGGDPDARGAGASGGAAYGLAALLGAELLRGAELVLDVVGFDERVRRAGLVLTGEGRLDAQSADGKACTTVARRARALGVETVAIVGTLGAGWERCVVPHGPIARVVSLRDRFGDRALSEPATCLEEAATTTLDSGSGS